MYLMHPLPKSQGQETHDRHTYKSSLEMALYLRHQFSPGNRHPLDLVIGNSIDQIYITDDFDELAVVDFRNQYLIEATDKGSQISGKGPDIA